LVAHPRSGECGAETGQVQKRGRRDESSPPKGWRNPFVNPAPSPNPVCANAAAGASRAKGPSAVARFFVVEWLTFPPVWHEELALVTSGKATAFLASIPQVSSCNFPHGDSGIGTSKRGILIRWNVACPPERRRNESPASARAPFPPFRRSRWLAS